MGSQLNRRCVLIAFTISSGSGATLATDVIDGSQFSYTKISSGTVGATVAMLISSQGFAETLLHGNVTISDSKGFIGLVSVGGGNLGLVGNVTLTDSKSYIGLTTVTPGTAWPDPKTYVGLATVTLDNARIIGLAGNVTLTDGKTFIGSVSVSGLSNPMPVTGTFFQTTQPVSLVGSTTLIDAKSYIGLVTATLDSGRGVGIVGNVTLSDPKTYIGLVTQTPGRFVGQAIGQPARGTFTITLASLPSGSARSSTLLSNISGYPAALLSLKLTAGGVAPAHNGVVGIYLIRGDGTLYDDAVSSTDSNASIINAPLLDNIVLYSLVSASYTKLIDTSPYGPLGTYWGIAIQNNTNWLSGTEGDHVKGFTYYIPENR